MDETDAMMILMLIGMVVILVLMWTLFPTMLIYNIIVTIGFIAWAVWTFRKG